MQKIDKKYPPILSNIILKKEIAHKLAYELNVNKDFMSTYDDLFMEYAVTTLKMQLYGGVIPYEDLEYYRELLEQKENIKSLLQEKI